MVRLSHVSVEGLLDDFVVGQVEVFLDDSAGFSFEACLVSNPKERWRLNSKSWGDIWALYKALVRLRPDLLQECHRLRYMSSLTKKEALNFLKLVLAQDDLRKLTPTMEFFEMSR